MEAIVPEPGVYYDIPSADYHTWDAASSHRLSLMLRSPAHCRAAIDCPPEPTDAMRLGEAVHYATLQPDLFAKRYVVPPKVDRRTKAGKDEFQLFEAANADKQFLSADEWAQCQAISRAVWSHLSAGPLLKGDVKQEVSLVWQDQQHDLLCKGRIDLFNAKYSALVDLKTTADAGPDNFERSIYDFGYHRQAAFYMDGWAACGMKATRFVFVAVEKSPPFAVAVYALDQTAIDAGRKELRAMLATYAMCQRTGEWPGYSPKVQSIGIPAWAYKRIERTYL